MQVLQVSYAGFDETYDNESRPGAVHPMVIKHHATGKDLFIWDVVQMLGSLGCLMKSDELLDKIWHHIETGPHRWATMAIKRHCDLGQPVHIAHAR